MPISTKRCTEIATALDAVLEGKTLPEIATSLGIQLSTLRAYCMSRTFTEAHPNEHELFIHARVIAADGALDSANDNVSVTKRSHQAKLARFDAERRLSRLWGAKQELTVHNDQPPPDITEVARRVAFINAAAARLAPPQPQLAKPTPSASRPIIDVTPLPDPAPASHTT